MIAANKSPDKEAILKDINNIVFSVLEKPEAKIVYGRLKNQYDKGYTETVLYDNMSELISSYRRDYD